MYSASACMSDGNPILSPEILLPSQYVDTVGRSAEMSPEKRLWLAVLEDAINCWTKRIATSSLRAPLLEVENRKIRLWESADSWIFAKEPAIGVNFEYVCDALDIDPDILRAALMRWAASGGSLPKTRRRASVSSTPAV